MIYTVTFNPSIDYVIHMDSINYGKTNRTKSEEIHIGGKGINVSLILKELGIQSVALGFVAGFTGDKIESKLADDGIESRFIRLPEGISRINVKLQSDTETEINAQGPDIPDECVNQLIAQLEALDSEDFVILAGSVSSNMPDDIYERVVARLHANKIKYVADTSGLKLLKLLKYRPFLVKPNKQELEELFDVEITCTYDIIKFAGKLRLMGAVNVLVSLGSDGAMLLDASGALHRLSAAKCKAINTVGAGDSMVAGFIAGYFEKNDYEYALKLGTACGGATANSPWLATRDKIDEIMKKL